MCMIVPVLVSVFLYGCACVVLFACLRVFGSLFVCARGCVSVLACPLALLFVCLLSGLLDCVFVCCCYTMRSYHVI